QCNYWLDERMRYTNLKKALYIAEFLMGLVCIGAALVFIQQASSEFDPIVKLFPGLVLLIVGLICLIFGIETFFFRDDPDIWR
ncbi:MAG TPA: hypothetical protein V6C72_19800, partial [Chroococcales cyanobacterium]